MRKELKHDYLSFLRFIIFIIIILVGINILNSFDFFKNQEEKSLQLNQELIDYNNNLIKEYKIDLTNNEKLKEKKYDLNFKNSVLKAESSNMSLARNNFYLYIASFILIILFKSIQLLENRINKLKTEIENNS
ncbi:hypothetical protein [Flavobacterium sp. HNIBRBA15423]|uniref:hypothetical protein n=1 Tax=Flavobacterium sp. HNIBRBA15423 TaxID=3458683 RepID=UPI004045082F